MDDDLLNYLPVRWDKNTWGTARLGRAAAYTLKARICLNWGRFEEAAKYSRIAMELAEGVYKLEPLDCTYYPNAATEGEPSAANLHGYEGEKSDEWMWGIQFNKLAASNTHAMVYTYSSRVHNGAAGCGPSQALMDTFQCTDGKSITESPLYNWQDPWNHRDPRLDLYCLRSDTRYNGVEYSTDPSKKQVRDYNTGAMVNNNDVYGNKSEYGPNGTKGIIVRHGEYMSVYTNMGTVTVREGAKVSTKQNLGTVYTNSDGSADFSFQLWKGTDKQDPERWLRK